MILFSISIFVSSLYTFIIYIIYFHDDSFLSLLIHCYDICAYIHITIFPFQ